MQDQAADNTVGIAERNPFAHQVICRISSIGKSAHGALFHDIFVEFHATEHTGKERNTCQSRVDRIKSGLLVFLHVFVVSKRQALHSCQK